MKRKLRVFISTFIFLLTELPKDVYVLLGEDGCPDRWDRVPWSGHHRETSEMLPRDPEDHRVYPGEAEQNSGGTAP